MNGSSLSALSLLLPIVLIPIFWLMIVRPQQERQRRHRALVASLQVGDRVESFAGIHGTLTAVQERTVRIEVAPGVELTMARLAIADRLTDSEDPVPPTASAPAPIDPAEDRP